MDGMGEPRGPSCSYKTQFFKNKWIDMLSKRQGSRW